jgi:hypothetical protein
MINRAGLEQDRFDADSKLAARSADRQPGRLEIPRS